jgi:hypothetical protein
VVTCVATIVFFQSGSPGDIKICGMGELFFYHVKLINQQARNQNFLQKNQVLVDFTDL